jgi:hypothetical protein
MYTNAQIENPFGRILNNFNVTVNVSQRQSNMEEILLCLEYLLRNKYQDYRIGQLMLCVS